MTSEGRALPHDVFICHASEDKADVARPLAEALRNEGINVWLDEFQMRVGDSLRRKIDEGLRNSAYGVVILSPSFFLKQWPQWELDGLADREMTSGTKVVLPVWHNMDHDDVAEHSPLLAGRLAARTSSGIAHVASEILQVLTEAAANPPQIDRVPRTPEEETQLLLVRPEMWEYLLFASVMNREKAMLEPKYRDYELGFIRPSGPELDLQESFELVKTAFYGIRGLVSNVERVLGAAAQERAFGPEGTPGDPERIEHLGQRIVEIYEGLLDWAEKLRGAAVPDEFTRIVEVVVLMIDRPISTIRTFIDQTVKDMDRVPALLREPTEEPVTIEASLVIDIDEAVMDSFSDEMDRLEATVLGGFDGAQDDPSQ